MFAIGICKGLPTLRYSFDSKRYGFENGRQKRRFGERSREYQGLRSSRGKGSARLNQGRLLQMNVKVPSGVLSLSNALFNLSFFLLVVRQIAWQYH